MGYYHSTYAMFGAEIQTQNVHQIVDILESPEGRSILTARNVGYSLCGPYDRDFLFLCRNHQEVNLGNYATLMFSGDEDYDANQIRKAAEELGFTLVHEPVWLVVPDLS